MWQAADYKLSDMLGIAGATIGILIAGGILLGWLNAKGVELYARYRSLTGEHRQNQSSDPRRNSLQEQISTHRWQILLVIYGSLGVILALLLFLVTVMLASLSVIYPREMVIRTVGTITLFLGCILIALGLALGLVETWLERRTVATEASDFSDIPSTTEVLRR